MRRAGRLSAHAWQDSEYIDCVGWIPSGLADCGRQDMGTHRPPCEGRQHGPAGWHRAEVRLVSLIGGQ